MQRRLSSKQLKPDSHMVFSEICRLVLKQISRLEDRNDSAAMERQLEREKGAIIGKEEDVKFFKDLISEVLKKEGLSSSDYPPYYRSLVDAVFHENWGLAGIAPWVYDYRDEYKTSSSAKIIGDRIYFLEEGKEVLQEQRISQKRRAQLKKALLLDNPEERLEYGFHEVYLNNGIRVTIYSGDRTKLGQEVIVFRKYVMRDYSFETMAENSTIPKEIVPILKSMCKIGFNVLFSGQVRSGKTTFLVCWQKYEDKSLEGVAISTDPEIPWHELMPDVPIMQLVADGQQLKELSKSLMRGDNDYIILEEMRDAAAYRLALEITATGTKRSKATIHAGDARDIPYKMASAVYETYGGDLKAIIQSVYTSFDYIFEFFQVPSDRSKKKLKAIWEVWYDHSGNRCLMRKVCSYDIEGDKWLFDKHIFSQERQGFGQYAKKIADLNKAYYKLYEKNPMISN